MLARWSMKQESPYFNGGSVKLYSYVGLVMALGSHFFEVLSGLPVNSRVALLWVMPYIVGTILIYWKRSFFKARFGSTVSRAT